jgi:carbon-monoxide dehydrogenase iron sulfur subunit
MACAVAHSDAQNIFEAATMEGLVSRTHVVSVDGASVPMQCRQCEDAPCTKVCPTGAMRQAESLGNVSLDEQSCIGCKLCSMVCPFGVITVVNRPVEGGLTNGGVATKCDLCVEWREKTGQSQTACENACPSKAIRLVDLYQYRQALTKARAAEIASAHRSLSLGL